MIIFEGERFKLCWLMRLQLTFSWLRNFVAACDLAHSTAAYGGLRRRLWGLLLSVSRCRKLLLRHNQSTEKCMPMYATRANGRETPSHVFRGQEIQVIGRTSSRRCATAFLRQSPPSAFKSTRWSMYSMYSCTGPSGHSISAACHPAWSTGWWIWLQLQWAVPDVLWSRWQTADLLRRDGTGSYSSESVSRSCLRRNEMSPDCA